MLFEKPAGVYGFFKEYRWLSNFVNGSVMIPFEGIDYPTVEHAYQAAKSLDVLVRQSIAADPSPRAAKRAGSALMIREDWDELRLEVMDHCLRWKFKDPELRQKLLDTGDLYLEETNTWGDRFWGVCNGEGSNHLGRLLVQIRSEVRGRVGS